MTAATPTAPRRVTNPRLCNRRIVIKEEDVGPCRETTVDPRSPMCYWHRLERTTFPGQAVAAELRLKAAAMPHRERVPAVEWPEGFRWCSGCQSFVPLWYCTGTRCKACARASQQAARRRTVYGLADESWAAIMELQGGRCAICRNRQRDRAPAVEHDHGTGAVRGGCCVECNHKLLGGAHDSPRTVAAALLYLLAPPTSGRWVRPEEGVDPVLRAVEDVIEQMNALGRARRLADEAQARLAQLQAGADEDPLDGDDEADDIEVDETSTGRPR